MFMKTIEEASKEHANEYASGLYLQDANPISYEIEYTPFKDGFKVGAEFAQTWIDVKKELPGETRRGFSDLVLTKDIYCNYKLERYDFEFNRFNEIRYDSLNDNDGQVTHWRPIEVK